MPDEDMPVQPSQDSSSASPSGSRSSSPGSSDRARPGGGRRKAAGRNSSVPARAAGVPAYPSDTPPVGASVWGTDGGRGAEGGKDSQEMGEGALPVGPTILEGLGRYIVPLSIAVVCSWGFVWVGAIFAAIGAVVGAVAGFLAATSQTATIPVFGTPLDLSSAMFGVFLGIVGGALDGFMLAYAGNPIGMLDRLIGMALLGVVVTALLSFLLLFFDAELGRFSGYRRASSREQERLRAALDLSGLGQQAGPTLRIADSQVPFARTLGHSIVLSSGMMQLLPDEELAAILSHELMHHQSSDGLAWRMMVAAMLPLLALEWLRERASLAGGTVGAMVALALFPVLAVTHGLVLPAFARVARASEYRADAGVAAAGLGDPLVAALTRLAEFEDPGTGFGHMLAHTHPPVELRIDALLVR